MNATENTKKLLLGLAEIDRMKREIEQLIRVLIDLCEKKSSVISEQFANNLFRWEITASPEESPRITGSHISDGKLTWQLFICPGGCNFKNLGSAQIVYQALPDLVEGLFRIYPELVQKTQPLIVAADANLATGNT